MTTAVIADEHTLALEGLMSLLKHEPSIDVVGYACDGAALRSEVQRCQPGLVITEIRLAQFDLGDFLLGLRRGLPRTRVFALTRFGEPQVAHPIIKAGVDGYATKTITFRELVSGLTQVCRGQTYIAPQVALSLSRLPSQANLTPREMQIVRLIAQGFENQQIAKQLAISPDTVRTHRNRLMRKLDIHNVAGLTRFALENGIS